MTDQMKQAARELLLKPLPWASYAAWLAVWLSASAVFGRPEAAFPALPDVLLFAWLACWLTCLLDDLIPPRFRDAALVALAALTMLALWFIPAAATLILLILLAIQLTNRLTPFWLVAALIGVNLYLGGVLIGPWGQSPGSTALNLLSMAGFQLFAVMVMVNANKSERMAEDLQAVNARLLATRSLLGETARDQERLRLSRELHDVAGHKLTALKLNLRGLARRLNDDAAREVDKATALADELLQDLRSVVRHLRETEGIDLAESLREVGRPFPRPRLDLQLDEHVRVPRADQAEAMLRVVQEGLTNAARHGPAETLRVRLVRDDACHDACRDARHDKRHDKRLVLSVEDDGRVADDILPGNGLTGMRERLAELNGSLEISRSEMGGVKLLATLPLELDR